MQNHLIRQICERGHLGPEKTEKWLKMDYLMDWKRVINGNQRVYKLWALDFTQPK